MADRPLSDHQTLPKAEGRAADRRPVGSAMTVPGPIRPSAQELEQIRYALDQSAIVAVTDVAGRIKYVNNKFCEVSKYSHEELIGQDHRLVNSGYHSQAFIRDLWRTIAQGRIWRGELRNRAKDGSLYWVDTTIVPFLDERGKPWQYMAIRFEITDKKRQEQRLRDQDHLLRLGQMAAVVAHEVRNPLAGIRGGVQLIGSQLPAGVQAGELIGDIVSRIDALNTVVEDLLAFARQRPPKTTKLAVATLLSDLTGSFRYDPATAGMELTLPEDPGIVIHADVDQLRLVFTNLLLNAAQAMNGQGSLAIDATVDAQGHCVISIADRGPGIPVELREHIFEPFFTTKHRGTGLGLPTARRLIEANGGTLDLLDRPGGGTIARVTLPGNPAEPPPASS